MRKSETNEAMRNRFRGYVATFVAATIIAIAGLGLVHQHNLQHSLAQEADQLDKEIVSVEERILQATRLEATLRSPPVLEQRVRELNLGLAPIQATQRLYLVRSSGRTVLPTMATGLVGVARVDPRRVAGPGDWAGPGTVAETARPAVLPAGAVNSNPGVGAGVGVRSVRSTVMARK